MELFVCRKKSHKIYNEKRQSNSLEKIKMIAQKIIEKTSTPDIAHPLPHSNAKLEVTNNLIKLY